MAVMPVAQIPDEASVGATWEEDYFAGALANDRVRLNLNGVR